MKHALEQTASLPRAWGFSKVWSHPHVPRSTLEDQVKAQLNEAWRVILRGDSGVGKTHVAQDLLRGSNHELRLFLDASNLNTLTTNIANFLCDIGCKIEKTDSTLRSKFFEYLHGKTYFLVFDNMAFDTAGHAFLKDFLPPPQENSTQLITTSDHVCGAVTMPQLTPEEGRQLIRAYLSEQPAAREFDELLTCLNHIPQAVIHACLCMAEMHLPVKRYLERYREEEPLETPTSSPDPIKKTWSLLKACLRVYSPFCLTVVETLALLSTAPTEEAWKTYCDILDPAFSPAWFLPMAKKKIHSLLRISSLDDRDFLFSRRCVVQSMTRAQQTIRFDQMRQAFGDHCLRREERLVSQLEGDLVLDVALPPEDAIDRLCSSFPEIEESELADLAKALDYNALAIYYVSLFVAPDQIATYRTLMYNNPDICPQARLPVLRVWALYDDILKLMAQKTRMVLQAFACLPDLRAPKSNWLTFLCNQSMDRFYAPWDLAEVKLYLDRLGFSSTEDAYFIFPVKLRPLLNVMRHWITQKEREALSLRMESAFGRTTLTDAWGFSRVWPHPHVPRSTLEVQVKAQLNEAGRVILHGDSGVGKTHVAQDLLRKSNHELRLFLDASNLNTLTTNIANFLCDIGCKIEKTDSTLRSKFFEYLHGKTYFLVFDNMAFDTAGHPFLKDFLPPPQKNSTQLITTSDDVHGAVTVPHLTPEEGRQLIRAYLPKQSTNFDNLLARLGYNPQAVIHACLYIGDGLAPPSEKEYLEYYDKILAASRDPIRKTWLMLQEALQECCPFAIPFIQAFACLINSPTEDKWIAYARLVFPNIGLVDWNFSFVANNVIEPTLHLSLLHGRDCVFSRRCVEQSMTREQKTVLFPHMRQAFGEQCLRSEGEQPANQLTAPTLGTSETLFFSSTPAARQGLPSNKGREQRL